MEPVRLGFRWAVGAPESAVLAPPSDVQFAASELESGHHRLGPLRVSLEVETYEDRATAMVVVRNDSDRPLDLESVCLGWRWTGHGQSSLRYLRHGWQSWSFTDAVDLDEAGTPPFPSGEWLRGLHHGVGRPEADRAGWHESHLVTVVGAPTGGPACLVGVLETGHCFGLAYAKREGDAVAVEVELRVEATLAPGSERRLQRVYVALGEDANVLLESFASLHGREASARTHASFQAGWCSWYHFFHGVTEEDVRRNLDALAEARDELPIDVVQIDDGYQRAIGDWLVTNEKFPSGLAPLARDIAAAGFRPGLWTAPFCVVRESELFREHPDWLLQADAGAPFKCMLHPEWTSDPAVFALDTTQDAVQQHLAELFSSLVEVGFTYLKLDFLFAVAMRAEAKDRSVTRAERLRQGLEAIRAGAGQEAFLLGCGCPLGPAVGVVDGMRIGADVAPSWELDHPLVIPGLEPALPATRNAMSGIVNRAWMHRRLWLNDPDCLMVRQRETSLTEAERHTLAAAIGATGGMVVFSDDVPLLDPAGRQLLVQTLEVSRQVDGLASVGAVRNRPLLGDGPDVLMTEGSGDVWLAALNRGDEPATLSFDAAELGVAGVAGAAPALGGDAEALASGTLPLAPHASAFVHLPKARRLAVFCDFDGTFSVQDVGTTIARTFAAERRAALWERFERGEFDAWSYAVELLDGFPLSQVELDVFLESIELDRGSPALLDWCTDNDVPFRVLSDGFDYNLDRLQALHGIQFEYRANHLSFENQRWRIAPGARNPDCSCGTGTCKRGIIEAWRKQHPEALCVHVGNGRVSDLCGALAADVVFAKDTLAPALAQRGIDFETFEHLDDVLAVLRRIL
ncbi:MAG: alpha-galactosidase [Proteobacteria bacterium]|nr:alpha-galactosidase [Pseudomonadota bacterium]